MKEIDLNNLSNLIEKYDTVALLEGFDLRTLKEYLARLIIAGTITGGVLQGILNSSNLSQDDKEDLIELADEQTKLEEEIPLELKIPNYKEKVEAIEDYMYGAVNVKHIDFSDIQLSADAFVKAAYVNNFDLPLMLAQCHLESCFGTTPRAKRTNSVFSIGLWDNGKNKANYKTQDESIQGYIDVMQEDYLTGDTTVLDLLRPGNFVNANGHRYASDSHYEAKVRNVRNRILKNYPILGK